MAQPPRTVPLLVLIASVAVASTTVAGVAASRPEHPPASAASAGRVVPEVPPTPAVTADGRITDMVRLGDRILVRGWFDKIGPYSGSGMPVDPATGERVAAPLADGQISVSVPDGAGGWYVAGDFRSIGDVRTHGLAHLGPDGTPDPSFTHRVNGLVSALAYADGTLWFGGIFDRVDATPRQHLAAISTSTGDLTAFSAPEGLVVTELAYAAASGERPARVYVGTDRVVALDPTTGATDPSFTSDLRGNVRALLVDGDRVLVGGHGLVALDADTGAVDTGFGIAEEHFPATMDGTVHTLLREGGRLYAGGDFASLGGVPGPLVALDATSGLGEPGFAPSISDLTYASSDRGVFDLTLAGGRLWVGGSFARVDGTPAGNLVALDPATGARAALPVPVLDNGVNAVDASDGGLYVGGQFFMTDAVRAPGFAALDAETLLPIASFTPRRNGYANDLVAGQDVVYLAPTHFEGYGRYTEDGRTLWYWSRTDRIRAVDAVTGTARPELALRVRDLCGVTTIGDELYVAQRLRNDQKFPRTRISVYSEATGELTRRFRLPLRGYVSELSSIDGQLLAAGSFRRFREDGQPAHLAVIEVSPRDGALSQQFDLHTHGPVGDVEVQGNDIYVAGLYDRVQDGTRRVDLPGLARFDRSPTGFAELVRRFQPPKRLDRVGIPEVTGLGDALLLHTYGSWFLDADLGARLPDPTGGFGPQVDDAVPDPGGLVYSAHNYVSLTGNDFYDLGFVARATTAPE